MIGSMAQLLRLLPQRCALLWRQSRMLMMRCGPNYTGSLKKITGQALSLCSSGGHPHGSAQPAMGRIVVQPPMPDH
jgi:hypothetical protein